MHKPLAEIGEGAFYGVNKLEKVRIPATVTKLGKNAFHMCNKLLTVQCDALTPPAAESTSFYSNTKKKGTLTVPEASLDAYKAAAVWKEFATFNATVGVDQIESDAAAGRIFRLNGREVQGDIESLQPGIYIIGGRKVVITR